MGTSLQFALKVAGVVLGSIAISVLVISWSVWKYSQQRNAARPLESANVYVESSDERFLEDTPGPQRPNIYNAYVAEPLAIPKNWKHLSESAPLSVEILTSDSSNSSQTLTHKRPFSLSTGQTLLVVQIIVMPTPARKGRCDY